MSMPVRTESVPLRTDADGVIRVGGTRVPIDTVVAAYLQGSTPEQISQDFSVLNVGDVYTVIGYYLRHREDVDAYLDRRRREAEELRREIEESSPQAGLRERLQRRLG